MWVGATALAMVTSGTMFRSVEKASALDVMPAITGSPTVGSILTCEEGSGGPYVRWIGVRPPDKLVGFGQVRVDQVLKESNPQYPPFDRSYTIKPSDAGKTIWCAQFAGVEGQATGSVPVSVVSGGFERGLQTLTAGGANTCVIQQNRTAACWVTRKMSIVGCRFLVDSCVFILLGRGWG
jgi:hypothetical protein